MSFLGPVCASSGWLKSTSFIPLWNLKSVEILLDTFFVVKKQKDIGSLERHASYSNILHNFPDVIILKNGANQKSEKFESCV